VLRLCVVFFQAEDGIRDRNVTGVQTCALPIYAREFWTPSDRKKDVYVNNIPGHFAPIVINMGPYWEPEANKFSTRINEILSRKQIGRASCRESEEQAVGEVSLKKKE